MKRVFYILAALAVLLAAGIFIVSLRFYTVIKVGGDSVRAKEYYARVDGFKKYQSVTSDPIDEESVRRGIIVSLVGDRLTARELAVRGIEPDRAEELVADVLSEVGIIEKASSELYGWSVEEFKEFTLLPQARRDLLAEALAKEGIDFIDWLRSALISADVKINFLPYVWEDGSVVEKPR